MELAGGTAALSTGHHCPERQSGYWRSDWFHEVPEASSAFEILGLADLHWRELPWQQDRRVRHHFPCSVKGLGQSRTCRACLTA